MNRLAVAITSLLVVVGCTSGRETANDTLPTESSLTIAAAPTSSSTTGPSSTTSSTTTSSTTTPATTTTPETTTTLAPILAAFDVAQQLATAYADGEWQRAREISPLPDYSDAELEVGYADLETSTLLLGEVVGGADLIQMWLLMVAHENASDGRRTSLYCVNWNYSPATGMIEKVSGELLERKPGFVPSADVEDGPNRCLRDSGPVAAPSPTTARPPASPPSTAAPLCPTGGLTVTITSFENSQPFLSVGGQGWNVQVRLTVRNDSTRDIQLVGESPKAYVPDDPSAVTAFGSIEPWRARFRLTPGQSVVTSTRIFASSPASSVALSSSGGWTWPDFIGC